MSKSRLRMKRQCRVRRIHVGEDGEVDAVRLDLAVLERAHDLVVAAGERQGNFLRHVKILP